MRRTLFLALMWSLVCAPGFAQSLGTITGEVRDATGGVVPGATVTVVNKATNATRTTSSNVVGLFDFPALPPGSYTVKSELSGFKTASREIELQVQQTARVNFTLELGTISELATVTGSRRWSKPRMRPSAPSSTTGASSSSCSTAGIICSSWP